ncbi:hypothetical protein MRX96_044533 [Rhipicephalus microplus]
MADCGGTNEMMQAMLERNRRLLELIKRKPETFHVMLSLNKAIHYFRWQKLMPQSPGMKPSKEPLRVKETIEIPERTVCWVTVESNKSEGNVTLPTGTRKEILLPVKDGMVEIPMLNNKYV